MELRSYEAARSYFSILGFLSWCVIVLGGIVAIGALVAVGQASRSFGGSPMAGVAGLVPGAGIMFFGFLGLVVVQIGRAGVDSAEYAQQSLKIAREQLEVSKQALQGGAAGKGGFEALQSVKDASLNGTGESASRDGYVSLIPASSESVSATRNAQKSIEEHVQNAAPEVFDHRGRRVRVANGTYTYDGKEFATREAAIEHIDRLYR